MSDVALKGAGIPVLTRTATFQTWIKFVKKVIFTLKHFDNFTSYISQTILH